MDTNMIYYVATNGNDKSAGTAGAPFATVEAARDAVRAEIRRGLCEPITVKILAGEYFVGGIDFDARDSGSAECPIVYEAQGEVVLNGGLRLPAEAFEPLTHEERSRLSADAAAHVVRTNLFQKGITRAELGEMCVVGSHHTGARYDGATLAPIHCELFVDGVRQTVARYPNEGFLYTTGLIREGDGLESKASGKVIYRYTPDEFERVRNPVSDIFEIDRDTAARAAAWKTLRDVWMFGYPAWNWAGMSSPIVSIGIEQCSMETKMVSRYGARTEGAPYYFYNVFEELDRPGEWYLDRESGWLYLYPAVALSGASIELSLLARSILAARDVSYLTFRGLTFTATRGDALTLSGDSLCVENCEIRNAAGNAMVVKGDRIRVRGCEMHRLGKGGVVIEGGDRATLAPSHNVLEYNHVHHFSEIFTTYQPAFSLDGVGNLCRRNRIHDSTHMAIYFAGNDHIIEYNEIFDVCKTGDDSSAVYAGRDYTVQGTVIRYNYFHDIMSSEKNDVGIFAVYCDDNLGKCTIVNNIFERCQSALLLHGGHDMTFCGNVIVDGSPKSNNCLNFSRYWYGDDLVGDGLHIKKLNAVPWQSEPWRRAYPHLEQYFSWSPDTEQIYPHYGNISGNIIIGHAPMQVNFPWYDARFHNKIENNTFLRARPAGSLAELCAAILPQKVEGFAPIPLGEIGCPET